VYERDVSEMCRSRNIYGKLHVPRESIRVHRPEGALGPKVP